MLVALGSATLRLGNVPATAWVPTHGPAVPPATFNLATNEAPATSGTDQPGSVVAQVDEPAAAAEPGAPTDLGAALEAPLLFFMPVDGAKVAEVASSFGDPRGSDRLHEGIDILAARGTPVRAAAPGTVRRVSESARGGLSVTIIGDDGLRYFYTHFDSFPEGLAEEQQVGVDTVIGFVGNTGNAAATAPHLHFGVYRPGTDGPWSWQPFDPLPFLIDRSPATTP